MQTLKQFISRVEASPRVEAMEEFNTRNSSMQENPSAFAIPIALDVQPGLQGIETF